MVFNPVNLKLVGFFIVLKRCTSHSSVQTTQNYADLLNSDIGEQVGKVLGI